MKLIKFLNLILFVFLLNYFIFMINSRISETLTADSYKDYVLASNFFPSSFVLSLIKQSFIKLKALIVFQNKFSFNKFILFLIPLCLILL